MNQKQRKSGPAIFMYTLIAVSVVIWCVCFFFYYIAGVESGALLWTGVVFFMIMYHLWLRLIMGNVSKLIKINPNHRWFDEKKFEKKLYSILKVKKWKGKALTYNPEAFSLKNHTLEEIALTMCKSEIDHWINEVISLTAILFCLIWGKWWLFAVTSLAAMIFDGQFIVIQRYNRPRIARILKKSK